MMVVLILKVCLSRKSKDDPSTLRKFPEMELSTMAYNLDQALLL